jgi:N-acyl-D-aspartate/D-glutamate deacylase
LVFVHPRTYGSFPKIRGRFVREQNPIPLEEAVRKATSLPDERLGIPDRGLLHEGLYADLVIFDLETIIDRSTYEKPHQYSLGIEYVVVNGKVRAGPGTLHRRASGSRHSRPRLRRRSVGAPLSALP